MLLRWRPVRQPVLVGAYGWQILSQYRFDGSTPTDAGLQRRRTAGSYRCLERHQAVRRVHHDHAILAARHALYVQARERMARWSRETHNWTPIGAVTVNPERDSVVAMASAAKDIRPLAA